MERALQRRRRDIAFTEGGVLGKIILFALPIMFTNVLQILFNAADMIVVGRFSGVEGAVGAVGSTGPAIFLIINLMIGVSVGANVVVSNAIGAGDTQKTRRAVHNALTLGLGIGVICMCIGLFFSRPLLLLMKADKDLLELSTLYLRIYFLGVPFTALSNYSASIFRAKGDARTPMVVMTCSGVLNVFLNLFFVCACDMSVDGVALATMIANAMSAIVMLLILFHAKDATRLQFRSFLSFDGALIKRMLSIGIPAGLQSCMFSLSNFFIQGAINSCGKIVIEGSAIAGQLDSLIFTSTNAFHQAALTFVGQNIGASRYDRLGRITRACYASSLSVSVLLISVIYALRVPLINLYIDPNLANVDLIVEAALVRVGCSTVLCSCQAFMDVGSGLLRAMNRSMTAFMSTLIGTCLFRIVWVHTVFKYTQSIELLYYSFPISWFATGAVILAFVLFTKKKLLKTHVHNTEAIA